MEVFHRISWDLIKNHADFIFFTRESTDQYGDIHRKWPLVIEQFAMGNGPSSSMIYDDLPIEKKKKNVIFQFATKKVSRSYAFGEVTRWHCHPHGDTLW